MTPVPAAEIKAAEQALREGRLEAALKSLQDGVRAQAADPKLRIFLFQLLCVLGQWPRAQNQLQVCGELDAGTLPMVNTYREALQCELLRESVFAGKTTPIVFGRPQPWVALLIEALQADARGDAAAAARLRNDAFDAAPATPGTLHSQVSGNPTGGDGDAVANATPTSSATPQAFDWIADADSRLGPVLEAVINGRYAWVPFSALTRIVIEPPTDLRDLVWSAAELEFVNGGSSVALIPTRYPATAAQADGALRLARRTDWHALAEPPEPHYRGLGQRVLTTSAGDVDLLQVREITLQPEPIASAEGGDPPAAGNAG